MEVEFVWNLVSFGPYVIERCPCKRGTVYGIWSVLDQVDRR